MVFKLIRAFFVTCMLSCVSTLCLAQDEDYFSQAWWSCELSGNQTVWQIQKYRFGISSQFDTVSDKGLITFSDDCIEISCENVQMHFPVKEYKRLSIDSFCVTRNGEDDYFDYIEVVQTKLKGKVTYRFMMAMLDPDGTMQNTHIFVCQPLNKYEKRITPTGSTVMAPKSDGMPVQVPD